MHDYELYDIEKWIDNHFSFKNYRNRIKRFVIKKYGKDVAREHYIEIVELAAYLENTM